MTVGASLGMTPKEVKTHNDTMLLDEVARRLVEHDPENADLISSVRVLWRISSGVAHGLRWPVVYRAKYGEPVPGKPGSTEARVTKHRRADDDSVQHQHLLATCHRGLREAAHVLGPAADLSEREHAMALRYWSVCSSFRSPAAGRSCSQWPCL